MVTKNKKNKERKPKPKKVNNLRHAEYYDMQSTFDELFAKSARGETFDKLMDTILSRENILLAYRNIKQNDGSQTAGTDKLTMRDIERYSPEMLVEKVRNITKNYCPRAVRRKEIPKVGNTGKTRPLGVPCIWDRLVQQCILQVLEPICEARFNDNSFGFRPNRSCEHAIAEAYRLMQRSNMEYVVEFDIKGFFDNVDHSKLIKQMWAMGIRDKGLIYVIKRILKAPIQLEDGTTATPDKGTPQGGIISPLLANIVLNELDWWIDSQWRENPLTEKYTGGINKTGTPIRSNAFSAMRGTNLKEMYIVRYADDFRIFCKSANHAARIMTAVKQWLKDRLRLDVSEEKTRVVNLKKRYSEFLGIKMRLKRKRHKFVVKSRVGSKAVERITAQGKEKVKKMARPPKDTTRARLILDYGAFVMGVHNYYQMATDVSRDFGLIGFHIGKTMRRLGESLKKEHNGDYRDAITERYGESAQLRWLGNLPIAPIGYVQTKPPMCKRKSVQKYTAEGRKEIHANLGIDTVMLNALLNQPLYGRSTEYADNRLSLYCAQYGKCAVTGQVFEELENIHCHHKLPRSKGGSDKYQNLILVKEPVHILIHAVNEPTIQKYLTKLNLTKQQLNKLNKLRNEAGNEPIKA